MHDTNEGKCGLDRVMEKLNCSLKITTHVLGSNENGCLPKQIFPFCRLEEDGIHQAGFCQRGRIGAQVPRRGVIILCERQSLDSSMVFSCGRLSFRQLRMASLHLLNRPVSHRLDPPATYYHAVALLVSFYLESFLFLFRGSTLPSDLCHWM